MTNTSANGTKKLTKKDHFTTLRGLVESMKDAPANKDEIIKFIDHEVELLSKRRVSKSVAEKAQAEFLQNRDSVLLILGKTGEKMTVSEIIDASDNWDIGNQKLTSVITKMRKAGEVIRTEEKKKAYYSLPVEESEEEETAEPETREEE